MVLHQGLAGVGLGLGQFELGVQKIGDRAVWVMYRLFAMS